MRTIEETLQLTIFSATTRLQ